MYDFVVCIFIKAYYFPFSSITAVAVSPFLAFSIAALASSVKFL
ncbi:hypothetical protein [Clostridium sp. Marseille-Q2269]|nr:hypothetical protein [Clostridium sp. Marseille-Q2269]